VPLQNQDKKSHSSWWYRSSVMTVSKHQVKESHSMPKSHIKIIIKSNIAGSALEVNLSAIDSPFCSLL
jgi:hypothetical protein